MPSNLVKPGEEGAWERAKRAVRSQYPNISESNPRFYKLTTTVFENMKAIHKEDPGAEPMTLIDQDDDAELHRTGRMRKALVGLILRPRQPQRPLYRIIRLRGA